LVGFGWGWGLTWFFGRRWFGFSIQFRLERQLLEKPLLEIGSCFLRSRLVSIYCYLLLDECIGEKLAKVVDVQLELVIASQKPTFR
jgi:hypothetical protein